ncbi:hypothetical protein EAF00_010197 [Botryotinia globosa]|nr:hypothetical protein EAF00_010197 [Botryotinia globosa]
MDPEDSDRSTFSNFRDAIRAVRRLGVKYFWIDSLCIIQEGDELADWKREAPVMHEADYLQKGTRARYNMLVSSEKGDGAWNELVEDSALARRGWVFQERLLSPRNIYFCKDIVLYECYEKRWSESMGPDVVPWRPVVHLNPVGANNFSSPTIKNVDQQK